VIGEIEDEHDCRLEGKYWTVEKPADYLGWQKRRLDDFRGRDRTFV